MFDDVGLGHCILVHFPFRANTSQLSKVVGDGVEDVFGRGWIRIVLKAEAFGQQVLEVVDVCRTCRGVHL